MSEADQPGTMPRWFGAGRDASVAFVKRFHPNPVPHTMFHYTTTAALVSIVRDNEMWLSHAGYLNDRVEIAHGKTVARERLVDAIANEHHAETKAMLEVALVLFDREPEPEIYIVCFSLDGDDLTQWRAYGQGAPVAIEIEHGPLMFSYASEALLQQVIYEASEQNWTFDEVLSAYTRAYRQDVDAPLENSAREPLPPEKERPICASKLYHDLWRYIVACKNPTFRSEREIRFSYLAHDFSRTGHDFFPLHPEPKFREQRGKIVPYLSSNNLGFRNMAELTKAPKLPIRSIRIGPMDEQPLIERGIRKLLNAYGHDEAEITMSPSSYRR